MERSDIAELMEKKYYKLNAKLSGYCVWEPVL